MAQKWANNDILISGGTYLGPKLKKKLDNVPLCETQMEKCQVDT